ncbi:type II toxin-antitoxin system mRNA interferase toxin, RelE/StbE family [Photorhabdus temperata]|uniref:type II toxin-antitoxin system mRNA interferase toxin, RelE/StbE family n=1 Tax=Photorhabdus temperata TaxID=574560 RepID=UPI001FB0741F|nr:type II toxin-antitoxin system mRNA interferase toxin, RelE/StbE family [Photorhabdus temperata]
MNRLKSVVMFLIANDSPLGSEYKDHELAGNWAGFRECHIGGGFSFNLSVGRTEKCNRVCQNRYTCGIVRMI